MLVADDERVSAEATLALLREEPRVEVVGTASDGLEAVESARALRPDVIVMDLYMPGLDGIEATSRVRAEQPDACVVLYTSSDEPGDCERALAAGAEACLAKQDGFERLVPTLLEAADRSRAAV